MELHAPVDIGDPVDVGDLAAALAAANKELKNAVEDSSAAIKTKTGGEIRYGYASLASILAKTRPILAEHGLSILQEVNHFDVTTGSLSITTTLLHSSGQALSTTTHLVARPDQYGWSAQQAGSAIQYGRRYAYMATLSLAATDEDDDGAAASTAPAKAPAKPKPVTNDAPTSVERSVRQVETQRILQEGQGDPQHVKKLLGELGYAKVDEVPESEWPAFLAKLKGLFASGELPGGSA